MKHKTLLLIAPLVIIAALSFAIPVSATPIVMDGDQLLFHGQVPGSSPNGGVFWFTDTTQNFDFYSYCLERSESISAGNTYWAVNNIGAVSGGIEIPDLGTPGLDELSSKTAYVFDQWTRGNLSNYSQDSVQNAIWYFEDEITNPATGQTLVNTVNALNPAPSGLYGVSVLNLYTNRTPGERGYVYSGNVQDVMFTPVPEPSTIFLMGLGLAGIGFMVRRRAK